MNALFLIPARGGSKGVPGKNIKLLHNKPLITYSIDIARTFAEDTHICVSTDDDEIIKVTEDYGLKVMFKRPDELSHDHAGSYEVIKHAVEFYQDRFDFDKVIMLQPTSPFRVKRHIEEAVNIYNDALDAVISVKESDANPYYTLLEENKEGYLERSKKSEFTRRQDIPKVYEANGSIYVINVASLPKYNSLYEFPKKKKYLMEKIYSVDIDDMLDWQFCEFLISKGLV